MCSSDLQDEIGLPDEQEKDDELGLIKHQQSAEDQQSHIQKEQIALAGGLRGNSAAYDGESYQQQIRECGKKLQALVICNSSDYAFQEYDRKAPHRQ